MKHVSKLPLWVLFCFYAVVMLSLKKFFPKNWIFFKKNKKFSKNFSKIFKNFQKIFYAVKIFYIQYFFKPIIVLHFSLKN
jgi:hypothetical protein